MSGREVLMRWLAGVWLLAALAVLAAPPWRDAIVAAVLVWATFGLMDGARRR